MRGVMVNLDVLERTIAGSTDYDEDIMRFAVEGKKDIEIYEALICDDMIKTADMFRPVYEKTGGADGFVGIELNPFIAHDTGVIINEVKRLLSHIDRPNVMIKVPATKAGIPVIEALIGEGINVAATVIFSLERYRSVVDAYMSGLETLQASGGDVDRVSSVASFCVNRVDTAIDEILDHAGNKTLQGKIAIANAKMAHECFLNVFSGDRWNRLAASGAHVQKLLWTSVETTNLSYSETLYVDAFIGEDTGIMVTPAILPVFLEPGRAMPPALNEELSESCRYIDALCDLGIDFDAVAERLQEESVDALKRSFDDLMARIARKRQEPEKGRENVSFRLHDYQNGVRVSLSTVKKDAVMRRIWNHDHTVWKPYPTEITNRMGWLHISGKMMSNVAHIERCVRNVRDDGYTHALLLGMGGSSLAPEVLRKTFGVSPGYLDLAIVDSTDPSAVAGYAHRLDPARTLFIVSTKSGTTPETLSFFKYFYNRTVDSLGRERAGDHFIAITDPGSSLVNIAEECNFRTAFINDPTIGGRYSALSYFGLVPAALVGIDVRRLLNNALIMSSNCESCNCLLEGNNYGGRLGVVLGCLAEAGRDKVTFVLSPQIGSFGDWVEQLIAESTGKEGKGLVPVVGETPGTPDVYGSDRLFVYISLEEDDTYREQVELLERRGHPVVGIILRDVYDMGGQFFLWEMATAVAGHILGINPFDQPDVESAKILTRRAIKQYAEKGAIPGLVPTLSDSDMAVYGELSGDDAAEALRHFMDGAGDGSYVAIQAYLPPTGEIGAALQGFRMNIRDRYHRAATVGYGPRFLHSTGQLHKGDGGKGLFIQITAEEPSDAAIPDNAGNSESTLSFGVLISAQVLGDWQALTEAGRQVIRFHVKGDIVKGIKRLSQSV
jgi:transaldolase/glucose-6-phosphate isomerase